MEAREMRESFRSLSRAGIKRAHFSARFIKQNKAGFIFLKNIMGPTGDIEEHGWIRPGHWHGQIPQAGQIVSFYATISSYRTAKKEDFGLFSVEVLV
jgi:hypothetical protein